MNTSPVSSPDTAASSSSTRQSRPATASSAALGSSRRDERRRPRPLRSRSVLVLAAAIAIAVGSFAIQQTGIGRSPVAETRGGSGVPQSASSSRAGSATGAVPPAAAVPIAGDPLDLGGAVPLTDTTGLTKAIGVWSANLGRDPEDFISAQNLAAVYYSRGRLTGSADDYARAQEAVDRALVVVPDDLGARTMRALLLYTLHDFAGALSSAKAVYAADRTQLQALATVGDSELELGQYDAAATTFTTLARLQPGAAVTARLARLASLRGDDTGAAALAARATREAKAEGAEGPALAFYPYLEGYFAFQAGRLQDAIVADRAALTAWPGSHLAHEGLAKALAADGRTADAIAEYRIAVGIVPQPEYLAGLGDLYTLTSQNGLAARQAATVRAIAGLQAKLYNRQLVLFDVNHGENLPEALTLAENEIGVRKDVYGWDAYAWALLANGRAADADAAMQHARQLGTRDALLDYHAGMIAAALGDTTRARTLLQSALDRNPGFDPLQAARARATLASLPAG